MKWKCQNLSKCSDVSGLCPSLVNVHHVFGSYPSCFFVSLKFLVMLENKNTHMVSKWAFINSGFRHSAFVQGVCYFFLHAASLGGPFLSCLGIYIDNFSAQDGFMVICPKHYWTKGRYKNTKFNKTELMINGKSLGPGQNVVYFNPTPCWGFRPPVFLLKNVCCSIATVCRFTESRSTRSKRMTAHNL